MANVAGGMSRSILGMGTGRGEGGGLGLCGGDFCAVGQGCVHKKRPFTHPADALPHSGYSINIIVRRGTLLLKHKTKGCLCARW